MHTLTLSDEEYKLILAGLLELPAKTSFTLLTKLANANYTNKNNAQTANAIPCKKEK